MVKLRDEVGWGVPSLLNYRTSLQCFEQVALLSRNWISCIGHVPVQARHGMLPVCISMPTQGTSVCVVIQLKKTKNRSKNKKEILILVSFSSFLGMYNQYWYLITIKWLVDHEWCSLDLQESRLDLCRSSPKQDPKGRDLGKGWKRKRKS